MLILIMLLMNVRIQQTQRYVRMYNLAEQKLLKTLTPGIRWISSMDVHPSGDHLIVGGYDRKLCWFDLELSDKPYKILRYVFRLRSRSQTVSPCQRQYRRGSRAPSPEHALRVPLERGSSISMRAQPDGRALRVLYRPQSFIVQFMESSAIFPL